MINIFPESLQGLRNRSARFETQDLLEVQTFYALVMSGIADCSIGKI
jgi:hypothetical protein